MCVGYVQQICVLFCRAYLNSHSFQYPGTRYNITYNESVDFSIKKQKRKKYSMFQIR